MDRCWICGLPMAGVRWRRLLFHVAVVVGPALVALYVWSVV